MRTGCAQVLSTRKRKDVEVADIKVQVCLFAFDCLYLNGAMLLQKPLTERRAALAQAVNEKPGELQFAVFKARRPPVDPALKAVVWQSRETQDEERFQHDDSMC